MMISDADFEELFFEDENVRSSKDGAPETARPLGNSGAGQPMPEPFQAAATFAMTAPFGAALAIMSALGAHHRT